MSPRHRRREPPDIEGTYMKVRDPQLLKQARQARGLTIRALAAKAGISPGFVSHLEPGPNYPQVPPRKNTCSQPVAHALAGVLHRDVEELFDVLYDPDRGPDTQPFPAQ